MITGKLTTIGRCARAVQQRPQTNSRTMTGSTGGVLPEPCAHRARTVRPFAYSVSTRSTMPESELPWLVAGLPVYYHRSNGDRVSATVVGPSPRGGRRVSIRYELGGEEVLYEHAPEERLEFAIVTAESPDSPQPVHHEAPMDALLEPQLPEVEAEAPRIDDHEPEAPQPEDDCPHDEALMDVQVPPPEPVVDPEAPPSDAHEPAVVRTEEAISNAPPPPEVDPEVQPPRKQYAPKTSVAARQRVKDTSIVVQCHLKRTPYMLVLISLIPWRMKLKFP